MKLKRQKNTITTENRELFKKCLECGIVVNVKIGLVILIKKLCQSWKKIGEPTKKLGEPTFFIGELTLGIKEMLTSGEGFLYSIKGEGTIWLQTREQGENTSSGGFVEGIFGMVK